METKTIENNFEVKEGRTIITVPHLEDKLSFAYPAFEELMKMLENKLKKTLCLNQRQSKQLH